MRKIESDIVNTIRNAHGSGSVKLSSRDSVEWESASCGSVVISVNLHGHRIASLAPSQGWMVVWSCGYRTSTTKSRLSAILQAFTQSRLYQKDYAWYVASLNAPDAPFKDGDLFKIEL